MPARRMVSVRALAADKGFDIAPSIGGRDRFRLCHKGVPMAKCNGALSWTADEAKRYLRRFPPAELWCR